LTKPRHLLFQQPIVVTRSDVDLPSASGRRTNRLDGVRRRNGLAVSLVPFQEPSTLRAARHVAMRDGWKVLSAIGTPHGKARCDAVAECGRIQSIGRLRDNL